MVALQLGDIEIVAADSMQVYRGMDIGTAKPGLEERAGIPHHMIDLADPSEAWDVARFVSESNRVIGEIAARGKRALFVGGTGLYLHALVDSFAVPGRWPEIVAELEQTENTSELHRRLAELDPLAAARTGPVNRRRVLRALEVTIGSGRSFSSYGPGVGAFPPTTWRLAGVWLPREVVAGRIERRFASMMQAGFADEVQRVGGPPGWLVTHGSSGARVPGTAIARRGWRTVGRRCFTSGGPHPPVRSTAAHVVAARPQGAVVRSTGKPSGNTARTAGRLGLMEKTEDDALAGAPRAP